jgi:hypothetical protein
MFTHGLNVLIIASDVFLQFLVFLVDFFNRRFLDQMGEVEVSRKMLGVEIRLLEFIAFHCK